VVDAGASVAGAVVGLIADELGDLVDLERGASLEVPRELPHPLAEQLAGVVSHQERSFRLLDLDRVLSANPRVRGPADLAATGEPRPEAPPSTAEEADRGGRRSGAEPARPRRAALAAEGHPYLALEASSP
jgi:hypothetical protein